MKKIILTLLCCAPILLAGCSEKEETAALVNGTKITKATYEGTLQNLAAPYQKQGSADILSDPKTRQVLGQLALQQLITNEVLFQEAQKQHIKVEDALVEQNVQRLKQLVAGQADGKPISDPKLIDKKFQEKLQKDGIRLGKLEENIRKELQAKALLEKVAAQQKVELQEQDIQAFYDNVMTLLAENSAQKEALLQTDTTALLPFAEEVKKLTAERAFVSAVFLATPQNISEQDLTDKQQRAKEIAQELKENKISFSQAIADYSDDKNALKTNGEQLVLRGALPKELDDKVFTSPLGVVVGPITQPEGIYIIRVNEKRAETKPVYTQLRNSIINNLAGTQIKRNLVQYTQDLINRAKVEILVPELKKTEQPSSAEKPASAK